MLSVREGEARERAELQLDLAAVEEVTLNGRPLSALGDGRVRLAGLAAGNMLVAGSALADAGGMDPGLIRFGAVTGMRPYLC